MFPKLCRGRFAGVLRFFLIFDIYTSFQSKLSKCCHEVMVDMLLVINIFFVCWFQVVTIDRERLISEKQNNKASPTGARLPKEAMLLRDIFKFSKPSLDAFRPFGLISRACQGPRGPPNSINVDHCKTD